MKPEFSYSVRSETVKISGGARKTIEKTGDVDGAYVEDF